MYGGQVRVLLFYNQNDVHYKTYLIFLYGMNLRPIVLWNWGPFDIHLISFCQMLIQEQLFKCRESARRSIKPIITLIIIMYFLLKLY